MTKINELIKPTWELYDLNDNVEHDLFINYITEFVDISGIKIKYYILDESKTQLDTLYGEAQQQNESYLGPFESKVVYDVTQEITLISSFGINSEDIVQYASMPKFTFSRDISASYHPKPGDVIQTEWNSFNYEVIDVHEESKIFQLGKMAWEFALRPYRFSSDTDSAKSILPDSVNTLSNPLSAYGDNEWLEEESDKIHDYSDTDKSIYGY
jgi:hypothetical protein